MGISSPFSTKEELALFNLRTAYSVKDVAHALELDSEKFYFVVKRCDDGSYYNSFKIKKKNGGDREIRKPVRGLALAQDRFAPILAHVYNPGMHVYGFVKGKSYVDNARYHHAQRWILNLDIEDFFPSITFPRVRGLFLSNLFGFNDRVATILARICTFEGVLPQGASTSPILANIISKSLDKKLLEISKTNLIKYSRYSDDVSFSSSKKTIPEALVKRYSEVEGEMEITLGDKLKDAFRSSGFQINSSKTRLMMRNNRQEVTGLTVNEKANIRRSDINRLRMKLHSLKKFGAEESAKVWVNGDPSMFTMHIVGWLAHIKQVRGPSDPVLARLCLQAHDAGITEVEWIEELADMSKEFDVFLSHASEDKDTVRRLKEALEELGVKVFFDETSIKWGDSIVEKVNHGLLKSTYFMPFLTDRFSKKGWTNKELNSAFSMHISRKGRILPIKSADFSIDEKYPLLNETLYKTWPSNTSDEEAFISEVSDEILAMIERDKLS